MILLALNMKSLKYWANYFCIDDKYVILLGINNFVCFYDAASSRNSDLHY